MANWYCSSVDYAAVGVWTAITVQAVGDLRRQTAPAVGSERVFRCTTAGTTGATEPTWVLTKSATTADGTAIWTEVTGNSLYNGESASTPWGAPFANLLSATATGWTAGGDFVYVRSTHSVSYTVATSLPMVGVKILCTNATSMPPSAASLTTGAIEQTTGAVVLTLCSVASNNVGLWVYGMKFISGSGANSVAMFLCQSSGVVYSATFTNCYFGLGGTSGGTFNFGNNVNQLRLVNCTFNFTSAAQGFGTGATTYLFEMIGGSIIGTPPTVLFTTTANRNNIATLKGVDLSAMTGTICAVGTSAATSTNTFIGCKLNAAAALTSSTTNTYTNLWKPLAVFYNCDSGATNYKYFMQSSVGSITADTTYGRSGGASDGTTAISWKAVTATQCVQYSHYQTEDIVVWNTLTGAARTATLYLYTNATLTNANCWMELEYLSDTGSPLTTLVSTYAGDLVTGTALSSDTSTWTGTALTNKYAIPVTFTPQQVGLVRARVVFGIASSTIYLDPKLVIT